MTQKEKIKDLEHRIELMNDGQSELVKQLEHFRNMASGYKGRNVQFQEEVKKLKEQVKHYKELDLEGDHLYEDKIKELEDAQREIQSLRNLRNDLVPAAKVKELEETVSNKNQFIIQLQEKVQELKIKLSNAEDKNDSQNAVISELYETIYKLSKPWWRRLF